MYKYHITRRGNVINLKNIFMYFIICLISVVGGFGISIVIHPYETETGKGINIEISPVQVPAVSSVDASDIVTVEEVDGGEIYQQILDDMNALGSFYNTESYQAFINDTRDKCVVEGNRYGAQCVSLAQAFWTNYAGRAISTCNTGAARGIWECASYNAGDEFELIIEPTKIKPGAWIVTDGGTWGHVAMAVGTYNNGYVTVYGENQGGEKCEEGGSKPNVINLSMKTFLGAFMPKTYIEPEPEPQPEPVMPVSGCKLWDVKRGDTMSKIMMDCENTLHYGEIMDAYAKTWFSLYYVPNQSVYDGWQSESGVGLYAGDTIEHRLEN